MAIDQEFLSKIQKFGRVTLAPEIADLPPEPSQALQAKAAALERMVVQLDDELDTVFPPVFVAPVCWTVHVDGEFRGFAPARCTHKAIGNERCFAVELSGHTPLVFNHGQLEAILAHEFLHYVWYTIDMYRGAHSGKVARGAGGIPKANKDYIGDPDMYHTLDRAVQADPTHWLTRRLRKIVRRIEMLDSPEMQQAAERTRREWVDRGYPTVDPDRTMNITASFVFNRGVIQKAHTQGLL